jgi:hypothetical protein
MHGLFVWLAQKRQTAHSRRSQCPFCCAPACSNYDIALQYNLPHLLQNLFTQLNWFSLKPSIMKIYQQLPRNPAWRRG